ncbi:MAG: hypothetical protein QM496_00325 [Verrucomicrobiota bacterium]
MTNATSMYPQHLKSRKTHNSKSVDSIKIDNRTLCFFVLVAPMAVLMGWVLVAVCLTGTWTWQLPLGLVFSLVGSMLAMISTLIRR